MINQSHGHWCNFLFCRRRRRRSKRSQVRIGKKSMHNSQSLRNEIFMLGDWSHQSRKQIHNQSSTAKRMLTRRRRGWRRRRRRKRSGCYINLQKKYTQDCKKQTRTHHPVLAFCPRIRVEEEEEEEEEGFVAVLSEDHVGRKIAAAKLQQKLLLLLWIANLMRRRSSCSPWYAGGSRWALRDDGLVHVIVVVVVSSDSCCCWQHRRALLGSFFFILADLHKQQQQLWMNPLKVLVFHFPPPLLKLVFHDLFLLENRSFQQNVCVCVCVSLSLSLSLCADNEDYLQLAQFSVLALVLHHTYAVHVKCWIP